MDRERSIRPLLYIYFGGGTVLKRLRIPEILDYHKIRVQETIHRHVPLRAIGVLYFIVSIVWMR